MKKLLLSILAASMIGTAGLNPVMAKKGQNIKSFDYKINKKKHKVTLTHYKGHSTTLHLYHKYKIHGKKYTASYKGLVSDLDDVKTVIFHKGVKKFPTALFNSSEVRKVYFPKTMTRVYDYSLAYLDNDDGKIKIYYAGSKKKWHKIFRKYHRKTFKQAKSYAAKGTSLADKLNELIGVKYHKSHFTYHFHAHIKDLKK